MSTLAFLAALLWLGTVLAAVAAAAFLIALVVVVVRFVRRTFRDTPADDGPGSR